MKNIQDTFETRKRSFISAFSICMTVPLNFDQSFKIQLKNFVVKWAFINPVINVIIHRIFFSKAYNNICKPQMYNKIHRKVSTCYSTSLSLECFVRLVSQLQDYKFKTSFKKAWKQLEAKEM